MKRILPILLCAACSLMAHSQSDSLKYKTIYTQGFSGNKSTEDFEYSDASKWLISKNGKPGKSLKCLGKGSYEGKVVGSPAIVAVLKEHLFGDFIVEMDVMQQGKDYNLLDFCLFFGIQDDAHFCYAQIAAEANKNKHNIFSVEGEAPKRLGDIQAEGVIWGIDQWNTVRLERNAAQKSVKVFFNDQLLFQTGDAPFVDGLIGFGSTSSAIKVDNVKVMAPSVTSTDKSIF